MGLRRRFNQIFRRDTPQTTADEVRPQVAATSHDSYLTMAEMFREEQERSDIIRVCRKMYDDDPRARKIIQALARDATKGGYQIEFEDDKAKGVKEALEIADALRDRLRLVKRLDDWCRLTFRDGDTMLELGVADDAIIEKVNRLTVLNTRRNSNDQDEFSDPEAAFWYSKSQFATTPPRDALWFAEWQIVHARWDHDEGKRYGVPLLASAKGVWKRIKEGELDISVRRKTRAGMKFAHILKGADEAKIAEYQRINAAALNNPFAAALDFFMNGEGDIKTISGDGNLGNITDVQHHINTFWLASPVPESIAGVGNMIDFSVVGHQAEQYRETLDQVQEWVADQLVKPILETQWLLLGILPERLKYKITWPSKKQATPDDILKVVQAAAQMRALGFPEEVIITLVLRYLPGVSREMLSEMGEPNAQNVPDRLAGILDQLAQRMGGEQTDKTKGQTKQVPPSDEDEEVEPNEARMRPRLNGHRVPMR
jgi:hypothetical protein